MGHCCSYRILQITVHIKFKSIRGLDKQITKEHLGCAFEHCGLGSGLVLRPKNRGFRPETGRPARVQAGQHKFSRQPEDIALHAARRLRTCIADLTEAARFHHPAEQVTKRLLSGLWLAGTRERHLSQDSPEASSWMGRQHRPDVCPIDIEREERAE